MKIRAVTNDMTALTAPYDEGIAYAVVTTKYEPSRWWLLPGKEVATTRLWLPVKSHLAGLLVWDSLPFSPQIVNRRMAFTFAGKDLAKTVLLINRRYGMGAHVIIDANFTVQSVQVVLVGNAPQGKLGDDAVLMWPTNTGNLLFVSPTFVHIDMLQSASERIPSVIHTQVPDMNGNWIFNIETPGQNLMLTLLQNIFAGLEIKIDAGVPIKA